MGWANLIDRGGLYNRPSAKLQGFAGSILKYMEAGFEFVPKNTPDRFDLPHSTLHLTSSKIFKFFFIIHMSSIMKNWNQNELVNL